MNERDIPPATRSRAKPTRLEAVGIGVIVAVAIAWLTKIESHSGYPFCRPFSFRLQGRYRRFVQQRPNPD